MSDNEFSEEKQKLLIEYMLSDEQIFQRVMNILKPEYFEKKLQSSVEYIINHSNEFSALPTIKQIEVETTTKFEHIDLIRENDIKWSLENIENFCKRQAIVHAVWKSPEYIENGDYGAVEILVKQALEVSLQKDLGIDYFHDPKARLKAMLLNTLTPVGWEELDRNLYGGLNRGEITIFAGSSGAGKSLFLQNIALNWVNGVSYEYNGKVATFDPLNVVYISLELSEKLIAKRIDTMVSGIDGRDIFRRMDEVEMRVVMAGNKSGELRIKQMPQGTTTSDIRAYLKEYEIQIGHKIDALCVDYLDLMMPGSVKISVSDMFNKDKYITEELRGLAVELDILCITASQLNRCILTTETVKEKTKGKIEIRQLQAGDEVASHNGYNKVIEVLPITKQPVFKIKTKSGRTITVSNKHKIPTKDGIKTILDGLKIGDSVRINRYI